MATSTQHPHLHFDAVLLHGLRENGRELHLHVLVDVPLQVAPQANHLDPLADAAAQLLEQLQVGQRVRVGVEGGLVQAPVGPGGGGEVLDALAQQLGHPPAPLEVVLGLLGLRAGHRGRRGGAQAVAVKQHLGYGLQQGRTAVEVPDT